MSSAKGTQMNVTMTDVLAHQARQPLFADVLTRHKAKKLNNVFAKFQAFFPNRIQNKNTINTFSELIRYLM
jgi:hypothetical protein